MKAFACDRDHFSSRWGFTSVDTLRVHGFGGSHRGWHVIDCPGCWFSVACPPPGPDSEARADDHGEAAADGEPDRHLHGTRLRTHRKCAVTPPGCLAVASFPRTSLANLKTHPDLFLSFETACSSRAGERPLLSSLVCKTDSFSMILKRSKSVKVGGWANWAFGDGSVLFWFSHYFWRRMCFLLSVHFSGSFFLRIYLLDAINKILWRTFRSSWGSSS